MKTVICAIAKFENDYIQEWVDYHLGLGFSQIYIYDNNDIDGERISDVLDEEIYKGKVFVLNVRGQKQMQKKVYNEFYHNNNFDWCGFIDIDEFITFNPKSGFNNINDFLATVTDFDSVHINWLCYGDNGKIRKQKGNVIDRFPKSKKPLNFTYTYKFPENNHIKSIIRKELNINWDTNPHTPEGDYKICDEKGNLCSNLPFKNFTYDVIFLRHYCTKTIEEYMDKILRQCADCNHTQFYSFGKFYRINRFTLRKYLIQKKLTKKHNLGAFKNSFFTCLREYVHYQFVRRSVFLTFLYKLSKK